MYIIFISIILQFLTNISYQNYLVFSPFESSAQETSDFQTDGFFHNNLVIVSAASSGIYIYNSIDPKNPYLLSHIQGQLTSSFSVTEFVQQNNQKPDFFYLLISNGENGICMCSVDFQDQNLNQNSNNTDTNNNDSNRLLQQKNNIQILYNNQQQQEQQDYFNKFNCQCFDLEFSVRYAKQINENQILISGPNTIVLAEVDIQSYTIQPIKIWNQSGSFPFFIIDYNNWHVFMANSAFVDILSLQNILQKQDNILITKKLFQEDAVKIAQLNIENNHYLYVLDTNKGVFISNITPLYSSNTSPKTTIDPDTLSKELIISHRQIKSVVITKDNNYLIIGVRSKGIEIYDISTPNKPYLSENLYTIGYANALALSQDESKLLFCNGEYMKIYEQMVPNLSINFPNLFNGIQSNLLELDFGTKKSTPWRVKVSKDNKYIYIAGARNGLIIYDISNYPLSPQYVDRIPCSDLKFPTDGATLTHDDNYLLIGEGYIGVKIVDVSNKSNIQVLDVIDLKGDTDDIAVTQDNNHMIAANGYTGISLVDMTQKSNLKEVSIWENNKEGGSVENVLINSNDTLVFGSLRYYGFVVLQLDLQNQTITEINEFRSGMCEQIVLSFDEKNAFLSDGTYGITIVDIQDIMNVKKISQVYLGGFPAKMRLYKYQDQFDFLLISQRDQELMAGVNVTDIYNPELVIKYQVEDEQSFDVECNKNQQFCYLVTDVGLRVLPMTTPIDIHHEFIEKKIVNGEIQHKQLFSQYLPIGKDIQIMLIPLRAGGKIKIKNMFYYDTYQLTQIPNYMSFNKATLTLDVKVNKDGIPVGKTIQSNILLVELIKQLKPQDFISQSNPVITPEQSELIIERCIKLGYISRFQFISDEFSPDKELFFEEQISHPETFNQTTIEYIKSILLRSQIQVPLVLNFANSLEYFPEKQNQQIIQSESNTLKVSIQLLNKSAAEFVLIRYPGAMVDSHLFIMEGPQQVVLQTLTQELITQNYTANLQEIQYKITINDHINHIQTLENNFQTSKFFKMHQGVQIGKQTIQDQFDQAFPNSKIHITREFQFQFSENSFVSTANIPLTYEILVRISKNKEFEKPQISDWIEVNSNERIIHGTPPKEKYQDEIEIKVIADDGYSSKEQIFKIIIVKIPWEFIIFYTVAIGSPLMTVLGFYQFRGVLWGIFCKKRYKYGSFYVRDGEEFRMQMKMTLDPQKKFIPLYKHFLSYIRRKKLNLDTLLLDPQTKTIDKEKLIQIFKEAVTSDQKISVQSASYIPYLSMKQGRPIQTLNESEDEEGIHYQILKYHVYKYLLEKNKPSLQLYNKMKAHMIQKCQNQNSWYLYCINIQCQDITDKQKDISNIKFIRNKLFEILASVGSFQDKAKFHQYLEKFGKDLVKFSQHRKTLSVQKPPLYQNFRRDNSQTMSDRKPSVKLQIAMDQDCQYQQYQVDDPNFVEIIQEFQTYFSNPKIDLILIMRNLMAHVLGCRGYNWFQYSVGESLHCDIRDIHLVKALIKDKYGCLGTARYFPRIFQFLNIDYMGIPMISNSPLPNWLTYQYHHDVIELRGFWDPNEADEFMIRIENQNQLIMKEFVLKRLKKTDSRNSRISLAYNTITPLCENKLQELKKQGRDSTIENILERSPSINYNKPQQQQNIKKGHQSIIQENDDEQQISLSNASSSYIQDEENCPTSKREKNNHKQLVDNYNQQSNINDNPLSAYRDFDNNNNININIQNNKNNIDGHSYIDISTNDLIGLQSNNITNQNLLQNNSNKYQEETTSQNNSNNSNNNLLLYRQNSQKKQQIQNTFSSSDNMNNNNNFENLNNIENILSNRPLISPQETNNNSIEQSPKNSNIIIQEQTKNDDNDNDQLFIQQQQQQQQNEQIEQIQNDMTQSLFKKKKQSNDIDDNNTKKNIEESAKLNSESLSNQQQQLQQTTDQEQEQEQESDQQPQIQKQQQQNQQQESQLNQQNQQKKQEEEEEDDDDDDNMGDSIDDHVEKDTRIKQIQDYNQQFSLRTNTNDTNQNLLNSSSQQQQQQQQNQQPQQQSQYQQQQQQQQQSQQNNNNNLCEINVHSNLDYNVNPEEELTTFHH